MGNAAFRHVSPPETAGNLCAGYGLRDLPPSLRRIFLASLVAWSCSVFPAAADPPMRQRLIRYFEDWYSYLPGARVTVAETGEVRVAGFEVYRVERRRDSNSEGEVNIAVVDRIRHEVFVGEVFHDDTRRVADRPFDPAGDLPNVEASLADAFGLYTKVETNGSPRGSLLPIAISILQTRDASVSLSGFVSRDGATLLVGEFHPLSQGAAVWRRRLLTQSEGVRTEWASFSVTEFIDFQCERCRVRVPAMKMFVTERGGAVETRFLPLSKVHEWAFAAAESAAALANVSPALYSKYEETVFARAEAMNGEAARELAADIAASESLTEEFDSELESGRARGRVLRDIGLAMRLGIVSTPAFVYEGILVSGREGLLERLLNTRLPLPVKSRRRKARGGSGSAALRMRVYSPALSPTCLACRAASSRVASTRWSR